MVGTSWSIITGVIMVVSSRPGRPGSESRHTWTGFSDRPRGYGFGHTLILGATGAGKSFTLNFLLVQALQDRPRVLILDLGGSYRSLTRFLGGGYLELSPDDGRSGDSFRLRPFSLPPGERTFQFLTGWVTRLLRLGGMTTSGDDPTEIRNRIEDIYAFSPDRRDLSSLVRSLPKSMWAAMGRWHGAGTWARYFDNPADGDDLEFSDWQVIDLAGAAEHEDLCEAAMFYLLERLSLPCIASIVCRTSPESRLAIDAPSLRSIFTSPVLESLL